MLRLTAWPPSTDAMIIRKSRYVGAVFNVSFAADEARLEDVCVKSSANGAELDQWRA
jgi:hypothetical protein